MTRSCTAGTGNDEELALEMTRSCTAGTGNDEELALEILLGRG